MGVPLVYPTTACFQRWLLKNGTYTYMWMEKMVGYSKSEPHYVLILLLLRCTILVGKLSPNVSKMMYQLIICAYLHIYNILGTVVGVAIAILKWNYKKNTVGVVILNLTIFAYLVKYKV